MCERVFLLCQMHPISRFLVVAQHCQWFMMVPRVVEALRPHMLLSAFFIHTHHISLIQVNALLLQLFLLLGRVDLFLLLDEVVDAFLLELGAVPTADVWSFRLFPQKLVGLRGEIII